VDGINVVILRGTPPEKFFEEIYTLYVSTNEYRIIRSETDLKAPNLVDKFIMIMHKPVDDIWLPQRWSIDVENSRGCHYLKKYSREFHSYKKSEVKTKFWFDDFGINK